MTESGALSGAAVGTGAFGIASIWLFFNSLYTSLDFFFGNPVAIYLGMIALWMSGLFTAGSVYASDDEARIIEGAEEPESREP